MHKMNREIWNNSVQVVHADMRTVELPLVDICVSELLGSFGDNELSPECLDGAQRFLKSDGISIPASYSSFLQPITTSKLWNSVRVDNLLLASCPTHDCLSFISPHLKITLCCCAA